MAGPSNSTPRRHLALWAVCAVLGVLAGYLLARAFPVPAEPPVEIPAGVTQT